MARVLITVEGKRGSDRSSERETGLFFACASSIDHNLLILIAPSFSSSTSQTHLVHLIHSMGGSIRKGMDTKVIHLICNSSGGDKYR